MSDLAAKSTRQRSRVYHKMSSLARSYHIFEVVGGYCGIVWNAVGIARFQLITDTAETAERSLRRRGPVARPETPPVEIAEAVASIRRYFQGEKTDFSSLPVDLGDQDELFKKIYHQARLVPWGATTTYGALAKEISEGREVARDVGQAMAKNPVALIIPCHRVLAAGGKLGGFSAPGGAATKMKMLALEGVKFDRPASKQQTLDF
jgi:methylated-DNA-[protein]-cysteine S-methyltransferase